MERLGKRVIETARPTQVAVFRLITRTLAGRFTI
jgi:hypothetical protein